MNLFKRYILLHNDIMHLYLSGYLSHLPVTRKNRIVGGTVLNRIIRCLRTFGRDFIRLFKNNELKPHKSNWIIYETKNNYSSLAFLNKLPNYEFVSIHQDINSASNHSRILHRSLFFYDFLFLPILLLHLMFNPKRKLMWDSFYILFRAIGLYTSCRIILKKYKPETLIFSNDHSLLQRSLMLAAYNLGIRTVYLQHASVSEYFPPLKFSIAFLEGMDAYDKYKRIGPVESEVELIGMCKFDEFVTKVNKSSSVKSVGVCFNTLDDISLIESIVKFIKVNFEEINVIIRPHPSDKRDFSFLSANVNDSEKVGSFEFLQNVDVIISGNSSIILEASLMNVFPIYFSPMSKGTRDYYGFVKHGLVEDINSFEYLLKVLKALVNQKPNVQNKASYYNEAVKGGFCGYSKNRLFKRLVN